MEQIRIHGRGGQGVVTAAELIALAAFYDGHEAQAFPSFGVERTGAPIQSFVRISNQAIITREQIYEPTVLIIQDATLLETVDVFTGCQKNTLIIINAKENKWPKLTAKFSRVYFSPATEIALEIFGKNIVNTVILFKHFMLKEIFEQTQSLANVLSGRIKNNQLKLSLKINPREIEKITIVACLR